MLLWQMKRLILLFVTIATCSCAPIEAAPNAYPITSVVATAYTKSEDGCTKTAMGKRLQSGCIASDWSVFPLGTKLKIDEHIYEVTDYGSGLLHKRHNLPVIDIYQPTARAMNKWGTRIFHNVEVVEWGNWSKSAKILKTRLKFRHCRIMYNHIQSKL